MKKITILAALFISAVSFSQIAGTSFEEPEAFSGKYFDAGDPTQAHPLLNNTGQPLVNYISNGGELGFKAYYVPYDNPDVGLTDGDFVGVTSFNPSTNVIFTDGAKGYQMNDLDGNMIVEFDDVDLTGVANPTVSLDFLLSINDNPTKGNYEGDGTANTPDHDRLRIYIKDLTNNSEIDLFNSTGFDLDEFVPMSGGEYQLQWQNAAATLSPDTTVKLVLEGRSNAGTENFWFDNIKFDGVMATNKVSSGQFTVFPNPASSGYVNIGAKGKGAKIISVYDVLGKLVIKTTLNGERLDISTLNSGIYILKIEQGKASTSKKLVVK